MATEVVGARMTSSTATPGLVRGAASWLRRPVIAGLVLLVAYGGLSLFMDPGGYLGTDTGGKVATLEEMAHHGGGLDPDVGYWAADQDPEASLHGLYFTTRVGDRYLNVTTLPMIYAALPLYELGGYRLALLIPMLGGVACAFAARAVARRVSDTDGWAAYWIVGLASPITIYSLDLWEHTLGAALMAWGIVVLVDVISGRHRWWRPLLAGVLFGAAFTMRTEALVYGFVAVGVTCGLLLYRGRRLGPPLVTGLAALAGFVVVAAANALGEIAVLGATIRSSRAAGTAASAGQRAHPAHRRGLHHRHQPVPQRRPHPVAVQPGGGRPAGVHRLAHRQSGRQPRLGLCGRRRGRVPLPVPGGLQQPRVRPGAGGHDAVRGGGARAGVARDRGEARGRDRAGGAAPGLVDPVPGGCRAAVGRALPAHQRAGAGRGRRGSVRCL